MSLQKRILRSSFAILGVFGLAVSITSCGSKEESSSGTRNTSLLAGTACTKLGSSKKAGGYSNVCASATPAPLWYQTTKSKGKAVKCKKPGNVKMVGGVAWVCSGTTKKASFISTLPLPVAVLQGSTDALSTAVEAASQPSTDNLAAAAIAETTSTTAAVAVNTTVAAPVTTQPVSTSVASSSSTTPVTVAPATTATMAVATCAAGGVCKVGDTGPGGGKVFFVSSTGFQVSATGKTAYYLEATKNPYGPALVWCNKAGLIPGADAPGIGDGAQNTLDIAKACTSGAGKTVDAFESGGKTDWYLPSKAELNEICKWTNGQPTGDLSKICTSGTLNNPFYGFSFWSSTENDASTAWKQPLGSGVQWAYDKTWTGFYFTPTRAF
jgi:hypothetical protein